MCVCSDFGISVIDSTDIRLPGRVDVVVSERRIYN